MPRDSSGVFTLVPGYLAVTGQTIEASQHNPPLEDIASGLTGSLPTNGSAPMLAALNMGGSKVTNLGTGTAATDAITKAQLDAAVAALTALVITIPPGTVGTYAGTVVPSGWLAADGSAVSRTTYAALFTAISTRYGAGDGSTTFNLPDLRGEFPRFFDNGRGIDPGRPLGSVQLYEIQSHTHGVNDPAHSHQYSSGDTLGSIGGGIAFSGAPFLRQTSLQFTGISIFPTGGSETRPRNIALLGMIKI